MVVPIYVEFGGAPVQLGTIRIHGSQTLDKIAVTLPQR